MKVLSYNGFGYLLENQEGNWYLDDDPVFWNEDAPDPIANTMWVAVFTQEDADRWANALNTTPFEGDAEGEPYWFVLLPELFRTAVATAIVTDGIAL